MPSATKNFDIALDSLAFIKVHGTDAQEFLQGQLSNDIAAIADNAAQLNAYCNPKGRMLAVMRVVRHGDGFGMIVPRELADGLIARLKMYVLRAKVEIGIDADLALAGRIGVGDVDNADNIKWASVAGIESRQIGIGDKKTIGAIADLCGGGEMTSGGGDDAWRRIDILSGIAQVYPATAEQFIPQMVNLDLVDGVSFSKGCYPGQEIIARLRYLGKVKQRMLVGTVDGGDNADIGDIAVGASVYAQDEKKVGIVVDAVKYAGEIIVGATAAADLGNDAELRIGAPDGAALTRIELPYSI